MKEQLGLSRIVGRARELRRFFTSPMAQLQSLDDDTLAMTAKGQPSRTARDWALLLLALRDATEPLDPVRIQTGMFLLTQFGLLGEEELYEFELLDSAPFSRAVQSDLAALEEQGLVQRHLISGYTWSEFTATAAGMQRAQALADEMGGPDADALRQLADAKQNALRLGFRDLLEHLAANYELPARKSVLS
jgi:hypothetical protein